MFSKYFLLLLGAILLTIVKSQSSDLDTMYLHFFGQVESLKKSVDILNLRTDMLTDKFSGSKENAVDLEKVKVAQKFANIAFDARIDTLPEHCQTTKLPTNCAEAMECTQRSGYYTISVSSYRPDTFTVFCDNNNFEGDWLYILRRVDGSENFTRSWSDYVNGFGDVGGEHWIGLENLYALTNFIGPQELYVYIENFEGENRFARYDNFVIGSASEKYKLKSLGRYTGTAGDSLEYHQGRNFSTFDSDNDEEKRDCANKVQGGFWFNWCSLVNPTGKYLRGNYSGAWQGLFWKTFGGALYSHKTFILMVRRQRVGF